jgi:AraC-like DNA-binding protein
MFDFIPYLSFLTSGIGLFFICYLLVRYGRSSHIYGLLYIIFALVFLEFYIYALTSKHIYNMLFLLRTPNVIRAFLPIVLFLYVRNMLNPTIQMRGVDWLHFIFPILVFVGVLPDLLLDSPSKKAILDAYYVQNNSFINTPSGWIPAGFVQPISILAGVAYGFVSVGYIFFTQKKFGMEYAYINRQSLIWLNLLAGAVTVYFLLQLYQYLNLFINNSFDPPSQLIKCILSIILFGYFITTPNVQENIDGCILPVDKVTPSVLDVVPNLLAAYQTDKIAVKLDQQIKNSQAFLDSTLDLNALAILTDMTSAKLSKYIKTYYGISFVELINRLRIHYFLEQRQSFDQYTLETYIYQSGFANRSTFYAAFKKYMGVNPSFYLKELNEKS